MLLGFGSFNGKNQSIINKVMTFEWWFPLLECHLGVLNFICTVYSRDIAVMYIAELDISRSHVGPHFLAHKNAIFFAKSR